MGELAVAVSQMIAAVSGGGLAQVFGLIMEGIGYALSAMYSLTSSYAIAIILVTIAVRALMLPLTLKSTRGMAALQKAQPDIKRVQMKYKALQQKARDRTEVQQIRMDMNREMNEVMRSHGASLGSGCLPQIAQFPVLIAMFSVMRAAIPVDALPASPIAAGSFDPKAKNVLCLPVDPATGAQRIPDPAAPTPTTIECLKGETERKRFTLRLQETENGRSVSALKDANTGDRIESAGWIAACQPFEVAEDGSARGFRCRSALGVGHLPTESRLFADVSADRATILGMHPGCTASQAGSKENARNCTTDPDAGGGAQAIPYYLLIGLVMATSYYTGRQMTQRMISQGTEVTQQQRMMQWMMPALFGLISLSLPAGTNFYYLFFNAWQIGQQHIQFGRQAKAGGVTAPNAPETKPSKPAEPERPSPARNEGTRPPSRPQGSKKKKRKRKKR